MSSQCNALRTMNDTCMQSMQKQIKLVALRVFVHTSNAYEHGLQACNVLNHYAIAVYILMVFHACIHNHAYEL